MEVVLEGAGSFLPDEREIEDFINQGSNSVLCLVFQAGVGEGVNV
jgi:hypothetical protein